jgi:hypothetical protein
MTNGNSWHGGCFASVDYGIDLDFHHWRAPEAPDQHRLSFAYLVDNTLLRCWLHPSAATMNKLAQKLGRLAKGKPKHYDAAELARRRERLAKARLRRWPEKCKSVKESDAENFTQ